MIDVMIFSKAVLSYALITTIPTILIYYLLVRKNFEDSLNYIYWKSLTFVGVIVLSGVLLKVLVPLQEPYFQALASSVYVLYGASEFISNYLVLSYHPRHKDPDRLQVGLMMAAALVLTIFLLKFGPMIGTSIASINGVIS